jgi:hypothetical protein
MLSVTISNGRAPLTAALLTGRVLRDSVGCQWAEKGGEHDERGKDKHRFRLFCGLGLFGDTVWVVSMDSAETIKTSCAKMCPHVQGHAKGKQETLSNQNSHRGNLGDQTGQWESMLSNCTVLLHTNVRTELY